MNTTELLAIFRQEVQDVELPYLWSDALIYGYIDEAQKQFCRQTYGIEDAISYTLSILADGTEWYAINSKILKIRGLYNTATGDETLLVPFEKMRTYGFKFDGKAGPLQALITGMQKGKVRAYPVPNTATTLSLNVFRLPEEVVAGDDFEIDDQHIRNLLHWVKYRAYDVQDAEVYNPKKSEEFKMKFDAYCAKALNEQSRINHQAGAVMYGGY